MRTAKIVRKTAETDIQLELNLDGSGKAEISTEIGFLDHMLNLLACHSGFDLKLKCVGDIEVDFHHSAEDIGICLGQAFKEALGDKKGIKRYGSLFLPMDEALVLCAIDISNRGMYFGELDIRVKKIGNFDTELIDEFFIAFAANAGITLHIKKERGKNQHHIVEAAFKGVGRALREAVKVEGDLLPSSKGVL